MPSKAPAREPAPIERYLQAIDHAILYRYPHVVGPPALAGFAWSVAAGMHAWADTTGQLVFAGVCAVVLLLGLDSAARLPGTLEQVYGIAMWITGIAWTVGAAWAGPSWRPAPDWPTLPPLALVGLLVIGWPPWFKHRRIRRAVVVAREIGAFDGEAVGLKGVKLSRAGATADAHGWAAPVAVEIPGSHTLEMLRKAIPRIAARMGCEQYSLSFEKVRGEKEGKYLLRRDYGTRHPEGLSFELPTQPTSARRPFAIGVLDNQATPMRVEVWRKGHGGVDSICAGMKGFGKTNMFRRVAVHIVASSDGLLWVGDMKPGSPDYGDLAPGCYAYGRTAEDIDVMIDALHLLCEVRGRTKRNNRKVVVALLDETSLYFAPSLLGGDRHSRIEQTRLETRRQKRFETLAAVSRAFDIAVYVATQRVEPQTVGGNNARANLLAGQVVGFYSPKPRDSALISADGQLTMHTLRRQKGACWLANHIHQEPVRGVQHKVEDAQVRAAVQRFAGLGKDLDDDERDALRGLGERWERLRPRPSPPGDPRPVMAVIEGGDPRPTTPGESRQLIWEALQRLDGPAQLADIAAAAGRGLTLTRARLAELAAVGCVHRTGYNRWTRYEATRNPAELRGSDGDPARGTAQRPARGTHQPTGDPPSAPR